MRGFESYNQLKANLRDSRQIYDITYHLYQTEKNSLDYEIENNPDINPSIKTSIGSIEHSPTALAKRLETVYPYKLRQLILISIITSLEVYLTDVILEVFKRDITPFKVNEPVTFQKNQILSMGSIEKLKNEIITKDFRNLTSGGLIQIERYYKKIFDIDLRNIGIDFRNIEEIHIRRHLFVHRNGVTDFEYVNKFPEYGFKVEQQIKLSHDYLIESLNKLTEFASYINKVLLQRFPEILRKSEYKFGNASFDFQLKNIILDISVLQDNFDYLEYFENLQVRDKKLTDFLVQITSLDSSCLLFLSGKQADLSTFYKPIIEHPYLNLIKTIELKNNVH